MNTRRTEKHGPTPLRAINDEMPNNRAAEQVVLGTLINFPERIEEVIGALRPEDFFVLRHRLLFEAMLTYYRKYGKGADFLTLSEYLAASDDISSADLAELSYLSHEMWSYNLAQDTALIVGAATQRRHIVAASELAAIGYKIPDANAARAAVEKLLYDLTTVTATGSDFESVGSISGMCLKDAEQAYKHRGEILGIPTGYGDLDLMTSGFQRTDLILLAGRPSMGKTSLGMGVAYNAARSGKAVAVFSLEMGKRQLVNRLLSLVGRIPSNRLRTGWMDADEWKRLVQAQDHLAELPLHIDDTSGTPISSIRSKLHRLKARLKRPLDLVVVDYLGLMEDEEASSKGHGENRNQEVSRISRGLKAIAREFNVPVLALAQLSRAVEGRTSKIPQLSDLRDSGSLEQDADIVAFVYRDEYYDPKSTRKGIADVVIAKHRNGPVGTISLRFDGSLTRFSNLDDELDGPVPESEGECIDVSIEYID
jgi:replicative DNA helicase